MKNEPYNIAGKLANTFINHPLTSVLFFVILVIGYLSLTFMPREENPQIVVSGGVVIVAMPGASADEIQKVVVEPLEKTIREISGVENIFSTASDSVGIVQIQYYIGQGKQTSDLKLYDQVMKNMDKMPKNAMQPIIKTMDIDTDIPIATIAFYSKNDDMTSTMLSSKIDDLTHNISKIDDVAQVKLKGAKKEQFNILVDIKKLNDKKITLGQVAQSLNGLTYSLPKINLDTRDNEFATISIGGAIQTTQDLENIIVDSYNGKAVLLKEIANITKSYDIQNKKEVLLYSKLNELNSQEISQITMTISKLKGTNTVNITNNIFDYLDSIKDKLEKDDIGFIITRDDGFTANHAVNELIFHLVLSIFIIALLLIFTLGFKEAIIVSLTVPMILSLTLFIGFMLGETINRITLFALLLSLGLLVDAAIIVIENIHRNLSLEENKDKSIQEISISATNEIGNPTNIATIAIIMTFIPMFFVGGMMGQFMHPLPIFVPISLIVSLFIAYLFTPYFTTKLLKKKGH